jgi:fatty acid desaturase
MNSEHEKALKEASNGELLLARIKLVSRRNLALIAGGVALVIILWARWSMWALIVPNLIWFAAAGQHFHIGLIDNEMKERKSRSDNPD